MLTIDRFTVPGSFYAVHSNNLPDVADILARLSEMFGTKTRSESGFVVNTTVCTAEIVL